MVNIFGPRTRGPRHTEVVGLVGSRYRTWTFVEVGFGAKFRNPREKKSICAFIRAVPGGKGLLAKSQPKATHRVRSPEAKDGVEIKSSSVAPYGQSLAGGEGAPQVSGGPFQQRINPLSSYRWSWLLTPLNQLLTPRKGPPTNLYPEPGSRGKEPGRNWT